METFICNVFCAEPFFIIGATEIRGQATIFHIALK